MATYFAILEPELHDAAISPDTVVVAEGEAGVLNLGLLKAPGDPLQYRVATYTFSTACSN